MGLWIFGGMLGVDAVTAAILGLSVLLVTGVVTWKECLAESVAWDTLTWFAALIAMAGYLNKYGLISWFSQTVVKVCLLFCFLVYLVVLLCMVFMSPKLFCSLTVVMSLHFFCLWKSLVLTDLTTSSGPHSYNISVFAAFHFVNNSVRQYLINSWRL